jgi:hypothetical protein
VLTILIEGAKRLGAAIVENGVRLPAAFIGRIVEEHKGIRRFLVIWAVCLITWVTWHVFKRPSEITMNEAAAYATTAAILGTVLGLYQVNRGKEDCEGK